MKKIMVTFLLLFAMTGLTIAGTIQQNPPGHQNTARQHAKKHHKKKHHKKHHVHAHPKK